MLADSIEHEKTRNDFLARVRAIVQALVDGRILCRVQQIALDLPALAIGAENDGFSEVLSEDFTPDGSLRSPLRVTQ